LIRTAAKAIGDSDKLQTVTLRPTDQPRSKLVDGVVVNLRHGKRSSKETKGQHEVCCFNSTYLMHEWDMSIATSTGVLKVLLTLLWRCTVPVLGIDIVGYSGISKRADG
jgi:hypothetical protein